MAIQSVLIQTIDTVLLEVPAEQRYAVTVIMICNTATANPADDTENLTNFDLHFVKQGNAIGNLNKVIGSMPMTAGETFTFDTEKIIIEGGDRIIVNCDSPTVLSATVSYLEL
jgi:hypothetical protein|tara:strand:- start:834 stop:1172 length:339 start_codon:yes stop_codon:yes gene_type:complete